MSDKFSFADFLKQVTDLLPDSASGVREDFERNLRPLMETALAKLNLVTREEFDNQLELLEQLQQKTAQLEAMLDKLNASPD